MNPFRLTSLPHEIKMKRNLFLFEITRSIIKTLAVPRRKRKNANPLGFVSLDAPDTFLAAAPTKDFGIMYRAGKTQAPNCIEIDYNSLEIVKSQPTKIHRTINTVHIANAQAGDTFTINIVKRGVTKHEKNIYRISATFTKDTLPYAAASLIRTNCLYNAVAAA